MGAVGNQEQSTMIDKAALETILACFVNEEMNKAQAMQAINRLAAHAFSQEQSEARQLDRNKQKSYPKNDYARWDKRDVERMMTMRAQGYEYEVISRELRRTIRSVRTKYLEVKNLEALTAQEKIRGRSS
jgi:hypothetical protein